MLSDVRTRRMFVQGLIVLLMLATLVGQATGVSAASPNAKYEYYVTGNPDNVDKPTSGGLLLMGGSTDVDAGFLWMIGKSGGGDFVVIRSTGTDAYDPWIYEDLGGVNSAATIIIQNRAAASDPFVVETILNAEALFIAGGDQANYVEDWKGTPVEDAIHTAFRTWRSHRRDKRRPGRDGAVRIFCRKWNCLFRALPFPIPITRKSHWIGISWLCLI